MILVATLVCVPASALIEGDYQPGSSFNWSPDVTYNDVSVRSSVLVATNTVFEFDQLAADINNRGMYFTIEHNARMTNNQEQRAPMNATYYYSNLPGVHYDLDDDDGDGNYEEVEAIETVNTLQPDFDYMFSSHYSKPSSLTSGRILTIAQRSILLGEYQAQYADYLVDEHWPSAALSSADQAVRNYIDTETQADKLVLYENHATRSGLDSMVSAKESEVESKLIKLDENASQRVSSSRNPRSELTITFTNPISMNELQTLLLVSSGDLKTYQAKFYDSDGNWCTLGSCDMNEDRAINMANEIADELGITHSSYEGITSAIIECDITQENISKLQNLSFVYFVDPSAFLWECSPDYDPSIDIVVPGYDWQLATFN